MPCRGHGSSTTGRLSPQLNAAGPPAALAIECSQVSVPSSRVPTAGTRAVCGPHRPSPLLRPCWGLPPTRRPSRPTPPGDSTFARHNRGEATPARSSVCSPGWSGRTAAADHARALAGHRGPSVVGQASHSLWHARRDYGVRDARPARCRAAPLAKKALEVAGRGRLVAQSRGFVVCRPRAGTDRCGRSVVPAATPRTALRRSPWPFAAPGCSPGPPSSSAWPHYSREHGRDPRRLPGPGRSAPQTAQQGLRVPESGSWVLSCEFARGSHRAAMIGA